MAAPAATTTKGEERVALLQKLLQVRESVSHVEKKGHNSAERYDFAQWTDVLAAVRPALNEHGVWLHLSVERVEALGGGLVLTEIAYAWEDVQTGARIDGTWAGTGWDKGDKALWKAYSGALKYLVLQTFLLPTGDDPEADTRTDREADTTRVERTTSRVVPKSRAASIVEAAKAAGIEESVFRAKLADLGLTRIVDLTVDAADAFEAWIASERKAAGE